MSPSPELAPPGSSSYDSNTMHVGDGTWDAGRDDFLLPNLVGLNFATMRYNGMGNRFFTMNGYQSLVKAHGILAAITFLGAVPLSIFVIRFYGRRKSLASKLHVWLNILTLLLTTVLFILGFMAVGPKRSLSNPHHGIGVAIYVLVWVETLQGCIFHRKDMHMRRFARPLKVLIHAWLGRALALLAIVQIALGLTLYGSPMFLFLLYALYVFGLVLAWFILTWLVERRKAEFEGSEGSYYNEEIVSGRPEKKKKHGGLGKLAAAGAAAVGLAALFNRRRSSKSRPGTSAVGTESVTGTSYFSDEKDSYHNDRRKGFGHRLLQIGAVAGGIAAAKKLLGREDRDDGASDVGPYRPPLGGHQSVTTTDSMSRIEEGLPPVRPTTPQGVSPGHIRPSHPLAQPPMTPGRPSEDSYSYYSYMSGSPSRKERKGNAFRNALAAGGAAFAVRQLFKNRRQKKEERRAEELRTQRLEEERIARMNSAHKYSGDGTTPPRRPRHGRFGSQTASDMSSTMEQNAGVPIAGTAGAAAASALADRNRIRPVGADPAVVVPGPGPPTSGTVDVPPLPPAHRADMDSSGSELYVTGSGRQRHRHRLRDEAAAGLAGAAVGAVAADAARRRRSGQNTDSLESPPVSVKVKMHEDGRHVTLRRLTEEEQAAQRRRDRRGSSGRRRRNSSFSSSSGGEALAGPSDDSRWRRTEVVEAQQAAENQPGASGAVPLPPSHGLYPTPPPPGTQHIDPRSGQSYTVPVPPPIPGSSSNLGPAGSITSPGTETSGATEYANNRRRRRAERAQARLAREGRAQNTVDFT